MVSDGTNVCEYEYVRVVVGDLAVDVVQDVRLRDAVSGDAAEPAHQATEVAERAAIQRRESAALEREFALAVTGKDRVGVLQERDQDEPVVDPVKEFIDVR